MGKLEAMADVVKEEAAAGVMKQAQLDRVVKYFLSVMDDEKASPGRRFKSAEHLAQLAKYSAKAAKVNKVKRAAKKPVPKVGKKERQVKEAEQLDNKWGSVLQ